MATLIEKTITTQRKCPKKHKVVKRFQIKDGVPLSYYFYCETCRKRYEESLLTPSAAQRRKEKLATKGVVIVSNKKVTQKGDRITRNNANGPLKVIVSKSGNVPKKCPYCSASTLHLTYEVIETGKKTKKLNGKECPECHRIFFGDAMFAAHSEHFVLVDDNLKNGSTGMKETDDGSASCEKIIKPIEAKDGGISFYNKGKMVSIELVQTGIKLPKSCYRCKGSLVGSVIELNGKSVEVKNCGRCETIHIHHKYVRMYEDLFIDGKSQQSSEVISVENHLIYDQDIKVEEQVQDDKQFAVVEADVVSVHMELNKNEMHMDDFGNEFDFTELNHLLNLK